MVIYKIYKKEDRTTYSKDGLLTKSDRVPQVVKDTLSSGVDTMQFDDQPDKERCLFCDEAATHERLVAGQLVPLGDYCYYNKNIGKVTERLNLIKKEKENGLNKNPQVRRRSKSK
jgi:hypothetical protein